MGKSSKAGRSDWVAVPAEFTSEGGGGDGASSAASAAPTGPIRPPQTPYEFFRREQASVIRAELSASGLASDVGSVTRELSSRWRSMQDEEKAQYLSLSMEDKARFARESHLRDLEVMERRERLQRERNMDWNSIILEENEHCQGEGDGGGRRTLRRRRTRGSIQQQQQQDQKGDDDEDEEDSEESSTPRSRSKRSSSSSRASKKKPPAKKKAAKKKKKPKKTRRKRTSDDDDDDDGESSEEEEEVESDSDYSESARRKASNLTGNDEDEEEDNDDDDGNKINEDGDEEDEGSPTYDDDDDDEEDDDDDDDENDGDEEEDDEVDEEYRRKKQEERRKRKEAKKKDRERKRAKKAAAAAAAAVSSSSQPTAAERRRERLREEKVERERNAAIREEDLRKDRAELAKKRFDFLLQQSDIFKHFGEVKTEVSAKRSSSRRASASAASESRNSNDEDESGDGDGDSNPNTFLTSQPSTLGFGKMRAYQLEGLNWMIGLQEHGVNGILADEMGLGKTLQSISIMVYMKEYRGLSGPNLIIVPKSTLSNWMNEIARWAPTLKAVRFHGTKEERELMVANILKPGQPDDRRDWDVCVTTYEVCNVEKVALAKYAWVYLIIDEAHRLKNEASTFSKTVRTFDTRHRLLLTGTPLQNNLHELWALLNFLVPDVFASSEQFDEWFNLDIDDADEKNRLISQLHKILRPFMLRRLKVDVETSLPPKHETILFTGMSAIQKKLYRDILLRDINIITNGASGGGPGVGGGGGGGGATGGRTAILNIVMQLRKCAGHPYLFPGVEDRSLPLLGEHLVQNCGKMVLLDKLLRKLRQLGHRVLLFTQMTRLLDILEDYMVMRQYPYCRIDGNTTYEKREESISTFNAPDSEKFIFLLSTRAGGLGLNLQTADVVILYDSDWNPQADLQAQDRAHRIGQKREVQVFRLVTEHTVEEKVVERAQQKLKLDAMVVQQGRLKDKDKLSRDDLLEAVRFGADKVFKSKDSSITDDDIDLILDVGKKKTQELNEKLQKAEKGDMLDFKLDGGGTTQTFEGIDYSQRDHARAQAQAQAELLGMIDIGKRERRTVANYNEDQLYRDQIASNQTSRGSRKETANKKKEIKLPKHLRLPRMEEWQMFDREALEELQEEEEKSFRELPEEQQKLARAKGETDAATPDPAPSSSGGGAAEATPDSATAWSSQSDKEQGTGDNTAAQEEELPPLLNEEQQVKKKRLLAEGFADWGRHHYTAFVKASAKHGRHNYGKIALDVGKSEGAIRDYATAFWTVGKERFSENEYDRSVKAIDRGEKKLNDITKVERATEVMLSLFEDPWVELEFTQGNYRDKLFTMEEDRHLLCWAHKYGYGQWEAVKMAIRRSPLFRFDYYIRCAPTEAIGRRCEQLMRAAEKEVEALEKKAREDAGLPAKKMDMDCIEEESISLPKFRQVKAMRRAKAAEEEEAERRLLEGKVEEIEVQMDQIQKRLKQLQVYAKDGSIGGSSSRSTPPPSSGVPEDLVAELANLVARSGPSGIMSIANEFAAAHPGKATKKQIYTKIDEIAKKEKRVDEGDSRMVWHIVPDYMHLLDVSTLRFLRNAKDERLSLEHEAPNAKKKSKRNSKSNNHPEEKENGLAKSEDGAPGPDGAHFAFPDYDGMDPPRESKKAFTLFCNGTRKQVKNSLDPSERKNKERIHAVLRDRWAALSEEKKEEWKKWEEWDAKRYARDAAVFEKTKKKRRHSKDSNGQHEDEKEPKRRRSSVDPPAGESQQPSLLRDEKVPKRSSMQIPKKRRESDPTALMATACSDASNPSNGGSSSMSLSIPKKRRVK